MALRDVNNFQFLREAIIQRFRNPNLKSFKGIPYEPPTNPHSIFGRTYTTFRELIGKGLNLHQYLNIGERSVLENLYQNLQSDINLRFLNDPKNALNDPRFEIPDQYYQEQPKDAAAKQAEPVPTSQTATAPVAAGTMSKSLPTSTVTPPRTVIPQAATEKLPTQTAAETERVEPIGPATAKEVPPAFQKAFENEPGYVTNPTELTPEQPTETGAPAPTQESSTISNPQMETSQSTDPSIGSFTTTNPGLKFQPGFSDAFKNFGSTAQRFAGTNLGRIGEGLKGIGRGITGPGLTSGANFLGRVGIGGMNAGISLSNQVSRGATNLSMSSKRLLPIFIGIILFVVFIINVIGGISGTTPTGQAAPLPPGTSSDLDKKYDFTAFNIFKSDSVNDSLLQKYIDRALNNVKVKTAEQKNLMPSRAKFIRDQAQLAGLNPAIFLGYWESESGFSDYTYPGVRPGSDLGCDPLNPALKTFEDSVLCAVGKSQITNSRTSQCALSRDINSPACQAIAFQQTEGVKLPINTLKDFLNSYGSKVADPNNLRSDNIVKQTIADLGLVPTINTPPSSATPYTPGGGSGILSCPVNNGSVIYGSKETGGHCATGYGFDCIPPGQPGYTGRETAVDVKGSDRMVFLPLLSGNSVEWTIDESGTPINDIEGGGIAVAATALSGNKTYRIRFVHIESTALKVGQKVNSATPVGQHVLPSIDKRSLANHVHITIQEDGIYKPADLYFNLCK